MEIYNIFSVSEATLTKFQVQHAHTICKGHVHIWEYMRSIFTDRFFFQIIPTRSKSEAGLTLDRINRDVVVANEILMDNAPYKTGYNTEMQRVERLVRMKVLTTSTHYPCQNKSESVNEIKCQEEES